jgi:hypothetical protein
MTNLQDLEKRLQEATGPDRVIDFWIAVELGPNPLTGTEPRPNWVNDNGQELELWDATGRYGFMGYHVDPNVSASLDAAIALAERVLPSNPDDGRPWLQLLHDVVIEMLAKGIAREHLARLYCLAIVRALIAKEDK